MLLFLEDKSSYHVITDELSIVVSVRAGGVARRAIDMVRRRPIAIPSNSCLS
jgi:hypothetical protein